MGRRSPVVGGVVAVGSLAVTTALLYPLEQIASPVSLGVLYLLAVLLVSSLWGLWLGLATSVGAALCFNFFHIPPTGQFTIARPRTGSRWRCSSSPRLLLGTPEPRTALGSASKRIADALEIDSASVVLDRVAGDERRAAVPLGSHGTLLVPTAAADVARERVAPALEALLAAALEREQLTREVVETDALRPSDEIKTAVLRSVSHDLRSPLTATVAAGEALSPLSLSESDRAERGDTIAHESARLTRLVDQRRVAPRAGHVVRRRAAAAGGRAGAGMRRVLVLDDEPQILRALRVVLREAGFEAIPAETAEEALDRASIRPPDAAIVDLVLPDGDGVAVTRELRRSAQRLGADLDGRDPAAGRRGGTRGLRSPRARAHRAFPRKRVAVRCREYLTNMCSHMEDEVPDGTVSTDALEEEICALAAHIHAATCRWLGLVAEYDRRQAWAAWGARSCAHWVSWRCGIAPVSAREHVRVARRLAELPEVREAFGRGELSYSKVRAITRVDGLEREADMLSLARHATAAQLERLVREHRGVIAVERAARGERAERWLTWDHDDDGSLVLRGRLPAEEGAVLVAALEAARDQLATASAEAADSEGATAEARVASAGEARADALMHLAETVLAGGERGRTGGDRYQVVVHVDTATLQGDGHGDTCELADGTPLAAETARRLACDASLVRILERDGRPLSVGRKTRTIPPALRRALAARDCGCRFPGCTARRFVDAHHIQHWARGGETSLRNLVQLCRHHHRLLHEGGYAIEGNGGRPMFRRPDGRRIGDCPALPRGQTSAVHTGRIQPQACVSLSHGERMDVALGVDWMLAFAPPPPPATAIAPGI